VTAAWVDRAPLYPCDRTDLPLFCYIYVIFSAMHFDTPRYRRVLEAPGAITDVCRSGPNIMISELNQRACIAGVSASLYMFYDMIASGVNCTKYPLFYDTPRYCALAAKQDSIDPQPAGQQPEEASLRAEKLEAIQRVRRDETSYADESTLVDWCAQFVTAPMEHAKRWLACISGSMFWDISYHVDSSPLRGRPVVKRFCERLRSSPLLDASLRLESELRCVKSATYTSSSIPILSAAGGLKDGSSWHAFEYPFEDLV